MNCAECPRSRDGRQLFPCVTPQDADVVVCIDEHALCDDVVQCPNGEDEDGTVCMFHRLVLLDIVDYFNLWAKFHSPPVLSADWPTAGLAVAM